jgi:hypothetical protein
MAFPTPSQGGVKFWQYEQTTPAVTWNIYHAFGQKPLVDILAYDNGVLKKAFPLSMIHVDDNNIEITWTSARTGIVSFASTQT